MKMIIDTKKKEIQLLDNVQLNELYEFLEETFADWRDYKLIIKQEIPKSIIKETNDKSTSSRLQELMRGYEVVGHPTISMHHDHATYHYEAMPQEVDNSAENPFPPDF